MFGLSGRVRADINLWIRKIGGEPCEIIRVQLDFGLEMFQSVMISEKIALTDATIQGVTNYSLNKEFLDGKTLRIKHNTDCNESTKEVLPCRSVEESSPKL